MSFRTPKIHHLLSILIIIFGFQLIFGVFVLVPVAAACQTLPTCQLTNLNPYIGVFYVALGAISYFEVGGEVVKNRKWFLTVISLVPILAAFFEFDLTQGGPFGTFRVGGITLEHEGFGLGIILGSIFFKRNTRLFWGAVAIGSTLLIQEYLINGLVDFQNNPFGIFFSSLLGFVMTYAVFRAFGYKEAR